MPTQSFFVRKGQDLKAMMGLRDKRKDQRQKNVSMDITYTVSG